VVIPKPSKDRTLNLPHEMRKDVQGSSIDMHMRRWEWKSIVRPRIVQESGARRSHRGQDSKESSEAARKEK
jgi:hypothetical protein